VLARLHLGARDEQADSDILLRPPAGMVTLALPPKVTGFTKPAASAAPRTRGPTVTCAKVTGVLPNWLSSLIRTASPGSVTRAIMRRLALPILVSARLCCEVPQAVTQLAFCASAGVVNNAAANPSAIHADAVSRVRVRI
jgi:hypothetical protein